MRIISTLFVLLLANASHAAIQPTQMVTVTNLYDCGMIVKEPTAKRIPVRNFLDLPNYITPAEQYPFRKHIKIERT